MKSSTDPAKGFVDKGAGGPGGDSQPDRRQTDPAAGHVKPATEKGIWQDVEFVPRIVEKVGG